MTASKASQRAVNKYVKNHYDRINVTFPSGEKSIIEAYAKQAGESVNSYIKNAVKERMQSEPMPKKLLKKSSEE
jgi:hypothetical protein